MSRESLESPPSETIRKAALARTSNNYQICLLFDEELAMTPTPAFCAGIAAGQKKL